MNELGNEYDQSDASSVGHMDLSDEEADEVGSLNEPQYTFKDEETKSRFTEYSMSSSVMRRNQQLTLLDDKFEKVYIHLFIKTYTMLLSVFPTSFFCNIDVCCI